MAMRPQSSGTMQGPQPALPRQSSGVPSQAGQSSQAGDAGGIKPPSKEEFLQMGVQHGGAYNQLARGLQVCKEGTTKDTIYKVGATPGLCWLELVQILPKTLGACMLVTCLCIMTSCSHSSC